MTTTGGDEVRRRPASRAVGSTSWIPLIVSETDDLIDETLLATTEPQDLYPHGRALVRRIVVRALFGAALGNRADELGAILEPAMTYGVQPALRQLPHPLPHTRRSRAHDALRDADRMIYDEIERRRRAPGGDERPDVLDTLIASDLSTSEIRDQTVTLIAAGYDTTASGFAWTVLRAADLPEVWAALRAEADLVFADPLDASTLHRLTYADAVVHESLRLHPPGVFSPRQAARDLTLGDFPIKKGTMILWSSYVAGRLPTVWDQPLEFRPERFGAIDPRGRAAIDTAWIPFGRGPRACIGFALAQMELTLALARLAQRVDIAFSRPGIPRPVGMIVNRPEGGLPAAVSRRQATTAVDDPAR